MAANPAGAIFRVRFEQFQSLAAPSLSRSTFLSLAAAVLPVRFLRIIVKALIALAVVGRWASSTFRFFVMAGLDPAIHENAEARNQANDNVT